MEIRDLARQVLGGTTLADKLVRVEQLTDTCPGPPIAPPDAPGRPSRLALRARRPKVPFPREAHLDRPDARGIVLHFFANHELLAIELVALALLRFPEAPAAFRRGLCGILREEQEHLALYADRMAAAGVELGDVPVSAFFWDCLSRAESPAAFVAGLSLTFEQANLDFAAHYAEAFRHVGDEDTAAVLDRVLADEIGHVRHGLHWFDRWRPPGDLWSRWVEALPAPLTPARAKGIGFVRAPRRAAGFDDETIDRLEVWSASRGRRPVLYRFDPEVDTEIVGLPGSPAGARIAADLDLLPLVLAGRDDALLVRRVPRVEHLRSLQEAGFELPEIVTAIDDRPWGGFAPWGLSPRICAELAPQGPAWEPGWARFGSKAWAAGLRRALGPDPRLAPAEDLGVVCHDPAEVREAIGALGERPFVVKAPHSTAGRDRRRELDEAWLDRTLASNGAVVVEPWLDRVADLSFQCTAGRLDGWGRFFTDARGQYVGTWLGRPVDGLDADVARFVYGDGRDPEWIPRTFRDVAERLGEEMRGFPGPVGVDALLYRRPDGLRLLPLLEVNPRMTMGRIALALARRVRPGVPARFDLLRKDRVRPRRPILRSGLLVDGVVPLTDPERASRIVAVLSVGDGVRP